MTPEEFAALRPGDTVRTQTAGLRDITAGREYVVDHVDHVDSLDDVGWGGAGFVDDAGDMNGLPYRHLDVVSKAAAAPSIELDPADPFDAVLIDIVRTNRAKRADYVSDDSSTIFENFLRSDDQVGLERGDSIEVMIATKQSRLRALRKNGRTPNNEAEEDTLLDRAVYSILALALFKDTEPKETE